MWVRVPPPSLPRKGLLWLCERLKGNMRRELRNEKYPFNCTDFASPNLRIYSQKGITSIEHRKNLGEHAFSQGSLAEEALGKGGDKADLNEESQNRLRHCQARIRVA